MENPNSWPDVVKCIEASIRQYHKTMEVGTIGYSLSYFLYLSLKENGFLKEDASKENPSQGLE